MTGWWTPRDRERHILEHGVAYDEARTAMQVAEHAFGTDAWAQRQNVRNDLYSLCDQGVVICDEERPMRFLRPDPTLNAE